MKLFGGRATVVSLTFDDGTSDHRTVAELLADRGLRATFYVNSGLVGSERHLAWEDVEAIAALGHEIGGHTRSHADLAAVSRDEAAAEILDDRRELAAHGLTATTFAYPYGSWTEDVAALVALTGYSAARRSWGLASDARTRDRPRAETLPPELPFAVRTLPSVESCATVDGLWGGVRRAARARGWLPLVFHGVGEGGTRYDVGRTILEGFVDRLLAARSWVEVRTVAETVAT